MRISDWSSDVCSSDLELRDRLALVEPLPANAGQRLVGGSLVERDEARRPAIGEILMVERIENAGPRGIGKTEHRHGAQMLVAQHRFEPATERRTAQPPVEIDRRRSDARRGGEEYVSTGRSRWQPCRSKKNQTHY